MEVLEEEPEGAQAPLETPQPTSEEVPDVSEAGNPDGGEPEEMASKAEPAEGDEAAETEPRVVEDAQEAEEREVAAEEREGQAQEREGQAEEHEGEAEEHEGEAEEAEGEAEEHEGEAEKHEGAGEEFEEEAETEAEAEEDEGEEEEGEIPSTFSDVEESSAVGIPESLESRVEDWVSGDGARRPLRRDRESDVSLGSPEREEDFYVQQEEEEEEEEAEEAPDEMELKMQEQQLRSELLEQYHGLLSERNRIHQYNVHLQHKISQALRKKKSSEPGVEMADKTSSEVDTPEKEQTYQRYLNSLEELKKQQSEDVEWYQRELEQLRQHCQDKLAQVEKEWRAFQMVKKQVILQAMGSCRFAGGKQAALREVEQIQAVEDRKEKEMSAVRLENVQLKQCLTQLEARMKEQEELTEGLHLIDFEQLKIENQTFNEKVEERNEELLKLHYKVTSNVQIITHVKEKLHFVEFENLGLKSDLMEIDAQVAQKRDILTKTKKARDSLRVDNIKLHQKCGLLGKEMLLRDLEQKVDQTELLSQRLETLKRQHAGLTLSCKGLKQKIKEAKAFLPS
ncbi:coiled-coil domain-containing protein 96 [Sarcophilus harrisii]|uniref:CCDC113/CCDC96 coiled-coil domain-containing protein n=1 Tax=Sarcophilus harrisii TaxID=9305 RepID=G3VZN1_SARHA|nr:coiled-coil domain-containing protein 96 [Sarcophilus harrisii]